MKKEDPQLLTRGDLLDQWIVQRLISVGGFGQVFSAAHPYTRENVAIKVEAVDAQIPLLRNEVSCLQHLNACISHNYPTRDKDQPFEPILRHFASGKTNTVRYLAMDQCGANLRELKKATPGDQFSIGTSLWIMERQLSALKFLHRHGWLHRDVKPANFCIGAGPAGQKKLYIIDFGMCRYYMNKDRSVKARKTYSAFHGTVRYASLTTHNREDISRYDDIWSVYYIAIENMCGALPWRFVSDKDKVAEMKRSTDLLQLKFGKEPSPPACLVNLQCHLQHALTHATESFYIEPPYRRIAADITSDMDRRGFYPHMALDWETGPSSSGDHRVEQKVEQKVEQRGVEEKVRRTPCKTTPCKKHAARAMHTPLKRLLSPKEMPVLDSPAHFAPANAYKHNVENEQSFYFF